VALATHRSVNGRKRHIVVDTLGLLMVVLVTAASVQDRDGGRRVLDRAKMAMPSMVLVCADGGYAGRLVAWARQISIKGRTDASTRATTSDSRCPVKSDDRDVDGVGVVGDRRRSRPPGGETRVVGDRRDRRDPVTGMHRGDEGIDLQFRNCGHRPDRSRR